MQKFPLRNRCSKPMNNTKEAFRSSDTHIQRMRPDCIKSSCSLHYKMPPHAPQRLQQHLQRICQRMPYAAAATTASLEKRQLSMEKPSPSSVKVCNRIFTKEADENVATWNDVLSRGCTKQQSKSLPSSSSTSTAVSFALEVVVNSNIAPGEKQEPLQRITSEGGNLEVPCNGTASSSNTSNNNNKNKNTDINENRNKDNDDDDDEDDDDNNRRSRLRLEQNQKQQHQNHQSKTQAEAAAMSAAASAQEFITFERLRLPNQINFLPFDPYRTLKFLITELKSRLKTVVPDDINVQTILVEIQQTIKRIRIPNNTSEPLLHSAATQIEAINTKTTTKTTLTEETPMATSAVEAVSTPAEAVKYILPKERCHIPKNNPLKNHARKVNSSCQTIASQLENNVKACQMCEHHQVNHQPSGTVGCNQNRINENDSNADDDDGIEKIYLTDGAYHHQEERSKDHRKDTEVRESFSCNDKLQPKFWKHCHRLNSSSTQELAAAGALSISKESQTNSKSPTQMFCHLEKEKLMLMEKFRTSEMQTIQGDLNELHVFIKDQLNGIYQSITRENQNLKNFSNEQSRRRGPADKNKQKSRQKKNEYTLQQPEKTQSKGLMPPTLTPLSSSPSLTAPTSSSSSSILSSSQQIHEGGGIPLAVEELTSILPRHYKKLLSSPPSLADNGNANNTKSMMKQKSSSSSLSDAKERHNISDVDKAYRTVGGKKSKHSLQQQLYGQEHLFANNCRAYCRFTDTPFCSGGKKNHFSNVDCRCRHSSHLGTRATQINGKVQRMICARAMRTSKTKSDINSTKKKYPCPGPAVMTHNQQHQHSATMAAGIAQDRTQLISSSLPAPAEGPVMTIPPSYISTRTPDETLRNPDAVTNAAVKTIIKDAYATTVTATTTAASTTVPEAAGHSNGIREPSHQARNSWQRVNLKNPTGCQMKKQICGADGFECTINNNNNDNRSNYPEIHDCQKYRANSINPFCGLCSSAKMHEVGSDNGATAFAATATASDEFDYDDDDDDHRGYLYIDEMGAAGDGPINWKGGNKSLPVEGNITCHPEKRQQQQKQRRKRWREQTSPRLLHCCFAQSAIQTDLDEFKEFLDEIVLSTPRMD